MHINGKGRRYMPLIGIVARKKDIKDIKRKLGENYELIELNSESIKNLKNILHCIVRLEGCVSFQIKHQFICQN